MSVSAQYAASARGKCAKCQGKIDKDELVIVIGGKRYQLDCVPAEEKVETQDITGISALQKGDLAKIEKKFGPASSKQAKSAAAPASSGRAKRSASVSKKKADSSDEEEEEEEAPAKKKAKKAAPAPKKKATPAKKKAKKQSDSEAEDEEEEDEEEASGSASESKSEEKKPKGRGRGGAAAAKKGKADKKKKEPKSKFKLPSDVAQKIRDAKEQLEGKNVNELKEMLAKNDQTKGGTRAELIEKVADGMAQGRIPRCPKCHGGRPRFSASNGVYACPGYGDDEGKFIRCSFKSTDLKREPWEN